MDFHSVVCVRNAADIFRTCQKRDPEVDDDPRLAKEVNRMPKMKTKRAAAKRFKLTGSGKLTDQEVHKEEEKPQKAYSGGRYQHQDNEEDHALSVIETGA